MDELTFLEYILWLSYLRILNTPYFTHICSLRKYLLDEDAFHHILASFMLCGFSEWIFHHCKHLGTILFCVCVCFSTGCLNRSWSFYLDFTLKFIIFWASSGGENLTAGKQWRFCLFPVPPVSRCWWTQGCRGALAFSCQSIVTMTMQTAEPPLGIHVSCELLK